MNKDLIDSDMTERIEIFSTDDEKIKSFGELLTNDSSRSILKLIFKNEVTANQISQQTGISLQLVKYHINKMQDMGIAKVAKVEKNSKGQDMKYYTATKFAIVILPSSVKEKAKESKSLLRSFQTIYKFAGVGVASVSSFFFAHIVQDRSQTASLRSDFTSGEESTRSGLEEPGDFEVIEEAAPSIGSSPESEMVEAEPTPEPEPEPEPEAEMEFSADSEPDTPLEETLELAQRTMEATEESAGVGLFGAENFWPLVVAIGVAVIGLAVIYFWRKYKHSRRLEKSQVIN